MPRKPRADGAQNLKRVLDEAELAFAEFGYDVPFGVIAERAGVSRTTIYRNFDNREDLAYAIFERNVRRGEDLAREIIDHDEPCFDFLRYLISLYTVNVGLTQVLTHRSVGMDKLDQLRKRTVHAFSALLERQQKNGTLRPDLVPEDLLLLMDMFDGALGRYPVSERGERGRRVLDLAINGLRCSGSAPPAQRG